MNHLEAILARKRLENARRVRRWDYQPHSAAESDRARAAIESLRRAPGAPVRVIAEVKRRIPSEGLLRPFSVGDVRTIARSYEAAGAAAISVLCDRAGFGGSVLDVRRASRASGIPILFKEFVLTPMQIELARAVGASLVLLLVRALSGAELAELVAHCARLGLAPVVEAASFDVDAESASRALTRVPKDRVAVYMSGVKRHDQLLALSRGRADAALVGTELMRAADPGERLRRLIDGEA
jgi:indole-3-glycerol phosphate synthase